jgi:NitT/TauT family transport system ATP-binding protein
MVTLRVIDTKRDLARPPALAFEGVAITLGGNGAPVHEAVSPVRLAVGETEFVALVGPPGCGASLLLDAAAGLLSPSAGTVRVFGQDLAGLNGKAGYLFRQDALMPWKTARDNVAIALEACGRPRAEALEKAGALLARVGLASFGDRYPVDLSDVQRRRVGLAQVLVRNPRILLMDEPFGSLDAQARKAMGSLLLSLWAQERRAVLFATTDVEEAIALADRVVILSAGPRARIVADHRIDLPRPRDVAEVRMEPRFQSLHRTIWNALRDEAAKASGASA